MTYMSPIASMGRMDCLHNSLIRWWCILKADLSACTPLFLVATSTRSYLIMSSSLSSFVMGPSDVAQDPNILPVPHNASDPIASRSDEYFWNKDLPMDSIVCRAGRANTGATETRACCPKDMGIYTTSIGCRMSNSTENTAFFHNCTMQVAIEGNPGDNNIAEWLNVTCVPFETYLNVTRQQRYDWLADKGLDELRVDKGVDSVPVCASVGNPQRFNYTGQCCAKLGGDESVVEGGVVEGDMEASSAMNCYPRTNDPEFSGKFSKCLVDLGTWPVCAQSRDRNGKPGTPAEKSGSGSTLTATTHLGTSLLVVGTALALLV